MGKKKNKKKGKGPSVPITLVKPRQGRFVLEVIHPPGSKAGSSKQQAPTNADELSKRFGNFKQAPFVKKYLEYESNNTFHKSFSLLNLEERAKLFKSVKDKRPYGVEFHSRLLVLMDCTFSDRTGAANSLIHQFFPEQLHDCAKHIFCHPHYVSMTNRERDFLKQFLVKKSGAINSGGGKVSNAMMEDILCHFQKFQTSCIYAQMTNSYDFDKPNYLDKKLEQIARYQDTQRFNVVRGQQAMMDYGVKFNALGAQPKIRVEKTIMTEYRAKILHEEGREPISIEEAAYLTYMIPYMSLTPYAKYCVGRFRELMVVKQWHHFQLTSMNIPLCQDLEGLAYYTLSLNKLKFMFHHLMNDTMLIRSEILSISKFPSDFPRRFHRLVESRTNFPAENDYLTFLFSEDEVVQKRNLFHKSAVKFLMANQILPDNITLAFNGEIFNLTGKELSFSHKNIEHYEYHAELDPHNSQTPWNNQTAAPQPLFPPSVGYFEVHDSPKVDDEDLRIVDPLSEGYINVLASPKAEEGDKKAASDEVEFLKEVEPSKELPEVKETEPIKKREPLVIEPEMEMTTLIAQIMITRVKHIISTRGSYVWTKFTLWRSSHIPKDDLLFAIMDTIVEQNHKIVIYNYEVDGPDTIFYSRYCTEAIDFFIRRNLGLKTPFCEQNLYMKLEVDCENKNLKRGFNLPNALLNILGRQLQEHPGHLNLSAFHKHEELEPIVFFPLNCKLNMQNVSSCVNNIATGPIISIDLSSNRISRININDTLKVNYKNLESLDLRNNELQLSAVSSLSPILLKKIYLDGNPLCSFYDREQDYISDVMKLWPKLEVLDSCRLSCPSLPTIKQHYFAIPSAKSFADQFLSHYFSIFDNDRRDLLIGLYHSKAMLSMTCTFLENQCTSQNARLTFYYALSRNIKKISNFDKMKQLLFEGSRNIMDFYTSFPKTRHDPATFAVDILHYKEERVQLSISGVFREKEMEESPRFFRKVMTLVNFHDTFLIVNEMNCISNCTTEQALLPEMKNVEESEPLELYLSSTPKLTVFNDEEKLGLMKKLSDITGMNVRWSKRCLDDMKWDLRNALLYFQKFYQRELIPADAFL